MPGMPSTPRKAERGAPWVSIFCSSAAEAAKWLRQPKRLDTRSPEARASEFDSSTTPTAPPSRAAPIWNGGV